MVAITVALDSRLAELGAQRFGRALADVRRAAEHTRAEVDALNAGTAGLGNTLTQLPANSRQAEIAFDRARRASMAMGQVASGGNDGLFRHAQIISPGRFSIRPRAGGVNAGFQNLRNWVEENARELRDILDATRQTIELLLNEDPSIEDDLERAWQALAGEWDRTEKELRVQTGWIRWAGTSPEHGHAISQDVRREIDLLRDEFLGDGFFPTVFPADELREETRAEFRRKFDAVMNDLIRQEIWEGYGVRAPDNALDPESWSGFDPGDIPVFLVPPDQRDPTSGTLDPVPGGPGVGQPDLFQHQRAGGIAAEADDLQRLVDARREDQIHLKRLEERRLAVAAAGAGEIAVIDDQAMALENVAMVNAGGAVSAQANADAMQMLTEVLLGQSETVDGSFTPATKGAAEATMELADAAVGLDAALKSPDPMAVAEDMEELSALGQQVGNSFASAFERAVFSGEELSDVLSALALDLARLVLQQQVLGPLAGGVGSIFDAVFGAILGVPGSSLGGVTQGGSTSRHTGGLVEHGAPLTRAIAPSVWLGASRYHFGGLAGDEVPAILRRGEEVLTRDDPRHRANGGLGGGMAGGGVAIHQTISIDARAVNENGVDGAAADAVGRQMRAAVRSAVQAEIAQQSRVGGMLNRV